MTTPTVPLTIGNVARLAGVGVETIRFYEREGLITKPPRTESGYRQYPKEAVDRVLFTKRAKELGFTLKEIRELLSLRVDPKTDCCEVRRRAKAKVADIKEKIADLEKMEGALLKLTAACRGQGPITECPILDYFDSQNKP